MYVRLASCMNKRICASALIKHRDTYLICKMPADRGVYPGQWAIPGGGIEEAETMTQALMREVFEEVGLQVADIKPFAFSDEHKVKLFEDGSKKKLYMIFLVFHCLAKTTQVKLDPEFTEFAWVTPTQALEYDLNSATRKTFVMLLSRIQAGLLNTDC